jgi:hypothetical protein
MPEPIGEVAGRTAEESFYSLHIDEDRATLRATMRGFWTVETAQFFMVEMHQHIAACRARFGGSLKQITDLATMPIQSQEVTAILSVSGHYKPGDRVATISGSALAKIAARRVYETYPDGVHRDTFLSPSAAETWLQAYS